MKSKKKLILRFFSIAIITTLVGVALTPKVSFEKPVSSIMYDKDGRLLGAKIAKDGQWRFPLIDSVPENFEQALLCFEDKRFHQHIGVDFLSLLRAIKQNLKAKRVVSGASTLTMQLARMARGQKSRTFKQKIIEVAIALKSEMCMSKKQLLKLYASQAPMGGNVIGLEAASWRYFSKSPHELSMAEAATLAVLPNAPTLIHPGKNRAKLERKRNFLLKKMCDSGLLDSMSYALALLEPIPAKPARLPQEAPHLLEQLNQQGYTNKKTTLDREFQLKTEQTARLYALQNEHNDIQNLGILILDTKTNNVLAYVGNSPITKEEKDVDMVKASRSSGSVLKPLLYAHALDAGIILPSNFVKDIPVQYKGYKPKNYNKTYQGAIGIDEALSKSLNIPAVELLRKYNISKFLNDLKKHGFTTLNRSAEEYGLSLILGGGEISLWELTGAYAAMARSLMHFKNNQSQYDKAYFTEPQIFKKKHQSELSFDPTVLSAAASYHTFKAMQKLSRPNEEGEWETFNSNQQISWKTGTSYGHRDAWAIGVSPEYTIGVWVGNADGEGRNELVGVQKAAPILFDLFNQLPQVSQFEIPYDDMVKTSLCRHTGFVATSNCAKQDTQYLIKNENALLCPYHVRISVDKKGLMVNSQCASPSNSELVSYLVLPPSMAYYYRQNHPDYKNLPATREDCIDSSNEALMSFIYPHNKTKIYLPKDRDGTKEKAVFKVAHRTPDSKLYWHLDNKYLGSTQEEHQMDISIPPGNHQIVVVDTKGNIAKQKFEILGME